MMTTPIFLALIFFGTLMVYLRLAPQRAGSGADPEGSPALRSAYDLMADPGGWIVGLLLGGLACLALWVAVQAQETAFRLFALMFAEFGAVMCIVEIIRRSQAMDMLRRAKSQ
jgi:hypothetical protein